VRRAPAARVGRAATLGVLLLASLVGPPGARSVAAHFVLSVNVRTVHVEPVDGGVRVLVRLPLPLAVVTPEQVARPEDPSLAAPYTVNRVVGGRLFHYVDWAAVAADPAGLGRRVVDGHALVVEGRRLEGRVEGVRVHPKGALPPFDTPEAAEAALRAPPPAAPADLPAGDAVLDVAIVYPHPGRVDRLALSSTLAAGLPGEESTENILLLHTGRGTDVFRAQGTLATPIEADASVLGAVWTFVRLGVEHILEGTDHVLFVLCLVLGAWSLRGLVARATGFTLGHSATLAAGFLGYAPSAAWFVPLVETGIALSIIVVAAAALRGRRGASGVAVTSLMGLLHGFGFAFVLAEVLGLSSSNLAVSLLSFNVGVEVGQLAIILLVWPALRLLDAWSPRTSGYARAGVACASIAVAAVWVVTRSAALLHAV
jgi:HupE / UreJ protein